LAESAKYDQAIMFFRRAVELKPNWALAQYNLGVVFLQTNFRAAALVQYSMLKSMDAPLAEKLYAGIYRSKVLLVSSK
jgi:tetratricopeptide (TPR) repeat protein